MSGDHNMKDSFECPRCGHCCEEKERDPKGLDQHAPGAKLDAGKLRPSLVLHSMSRAIDAIVQISEYGAKKYSPGGWHYVEDGYERYTDALMRHLLVEERETWDKESEFLHVAHVAWNAVARLELLLAEESLELKVSHD